ncbi:hypothetical protein FB446DRAFT_795902 [Lentinula raphanica]|nr:hypothetical protein FB446DRAFT_795902 [Lentinula raphanica]
MRKRACLNPFTEPADEFEHDSDTDDKIRKPLGEVDKPSRGGYNLRITLGWADDRFNDVEKFIKEAIEKKLDTTQSFDQQPLSDLKEVREQAVRRYPFLNEYLGNWVVDDFIKRDLKHRRREISKKTSKTRKGKERSNN